MHVFHKLRNLNWSRVVAASDAVAGETGELVDEGE